MPDVVLKRGSRIEEVASVEVPEWVRHTVRLQPVTAADFAIPWSGGAARAIGLVTDQVVTESLTVEPRVVDDGRVIAECPLPVAGLLSDQPLDVVVGQSRACNEAAHGLGWKGATPFLTLAFLALSVIPSLKLTDKGLVDVDRFELVPIVAGEPTLPRH